MRKVLRESYMQISHANFSILPLLIMLATQTSCVLDISANSTVDRCPSALLANRWSLRIVPSFENAFSAFMAGNSVNVFSKPSSVMEFAHLSAISWLTALLTDVIYPVKPSVCGSVLKKLKILYSIVVLEPVYVVNNLNSGQVSSRCFSITSLCSPRYPFLSQFGWSGTQIWIYPSEVLILPPFQNLDFGPT